MKKMSLVVCLSIALGIGSCTKKEPVVPFTHATMKPWFDTYCLSCHGSGKSDADAWEYNSNDFNNCIKKYIGDIKKEVVDKKSMPKGNSLSASELQVFIDWYNAGYPIN